MTDLNTFPLPRPGAAPDAGPLDDALYDLVEARFRRLLATTPILGTYVGIHTEDHRLSDGSRDAVLGEIEDEGRHLAAVEALDPAGLSPTARFERDLEVHNVRRSLFDAAEIRRWERRSSGMDELGDSIFMLFARDFAPLRERVDAIASRLEAAPGFLHRSRSRLVGTPVTVWQKQELQVARHLPSLFHEVAAAAAEPDAAIPAPERDRLDRAIAAADEALTDHAAWVEGTLASATDDWAVGPEAYDELVARRAFDGLDADQILEIGWEQLRLNREARRACARELDPDAEEAAVIARVKDDHPATFEEALEGYRDAMHRARAHIVARGIATVPDDERIEVVPTPAHLRAVMPFAAYFPTAKFDADQTGVYLVTPSVDEDPGAMREHYRASISNTSIHEAYPGHHLQLTVAGRHPSLTRLLADAPEFVEGWGMYSEQMMREERFDDGPAFRLALHTDAIWRACRIILDVRMHRGEVTTQEAVDFLVEHTSFEVPNATAEVNRYTYTPTYQLSYLLGKVLILGLREDERRRRGADFSLRAFHDTLLRNGSLPISFHRRLFTEARAQAPGPARS